MVVSITWRACPPLKGAAWTFMHSSTTLGRLRLLAQVLMLTDWLNAASAPTLRDRLRQDMPGGVLTVYPCRSVLCLGRWLSHPPTLAPLSIQSMLSTHRPCSSCCMHRCCRCPSVAVCITTMLAPVLEHGSIPARAPLAHPPTQVVWVGGNSPIISTCAGWPYVQLLATIEVVALSQA